MFLFSAALTTLVVMCVCCFAGDASPLLASARVQVEARVYAPQEVCLRVVNEHNSEAIARASAELVSLLAGSSKTDDFTMASGDAIPTLTPIVEFDIVNGRAALHFTNLARSVEILHNTDATNENFDEVFREVQAAIQRRVEVTITSDLMKQNATAAIEGWPSTTCVWINDVVATEQERQLFKAYVSADSRHTVVSEVHEITNHSLSKFFFLPTIPSKNESSEQPTLSNNDNGPWTLLVYLFLVIILVAICGAIALCTRIRTKHAQTQAKKKGEIRKKIEMLRKKQNLDQQLQEGEQHKEANGAEQHESAAITIEPQTSSNGLILTTAQNPPANTGGPQRHEDDEAEEVEVDDQPVEKPVRLPSAARSDDSNLLQKEGDLNKSRKMEIGLDDSSNSSESAGMKIKKEESPSKPLVVENSKSRPQRARIRRKQVENTGKIAGSPKKNQQQQSPEQKADVPSPQVQEKIDAFFLKLKTFYSLHKVPKTDADLLRIATSFWDREAKFLAFLHKKYDGAKTVNKSVSPKAGTYHQTVEGAETTK